MLYGQSVAKGKVFFGDATDPPKDAVFFLTADSFFATTKNNSVQCHNAGKNFLKNISSGMNPGASSWGVLMQLEAGQLTGV